MSRESFVHTSFESFSLNGHQSCYAAYLNVFLRASAMPLVSASPIFLTSTLRSKRSPQLLQVPSSCVSGVSPLVSCVLPHFGQRMGVVPRSYVLTANSFVRSFYARNSNLARLKFSLRFLGVDIRSFFNLSVARISTQRRPQVSKGQL